MTSIFSKCCKKISQRGSKRVTKKDKLEDSSKSLESAPNYKQFSSPKMKSVVRARKLEESTAKFKRLNKLEDDQFGVELSSDRNQLTYKNNMENISEERTSVVDFNQKLQNIGEKSPLKREMVNSSVQTDQLMMIRYINDRYGTQINPNNFQTLESTFRNRDKIQTNQDGINISNADSVKFNSFRSKDTIEEKSDKISQDSFSTLTDKNSSLHVVEYDGSHQTEDSIVKPSVPNLNLKELQKIPTNFTKVPQLARKRKKKSFTQQVRQEKSLKVKNHKIHANEYRKSFNTTRDGRQPKEPPKEQVFKFKQKIERSCTLSKQDKPELAQEIITVESPNLFKSKSCEEGESDKCEVVSSPEPSQKDVPRKSSGVKTKLKQNDIGEENQSKSEEINTSFGDTSRPENSSHSKLDTSFGESSYLSKSKRIVKPSDSNSDSYLSETGDQVIKFPKRDFSVQPLKLWKKGLTRVEIKLQEYNKNNEISIEVDSNRSVQDSQIRYQHKIEDLNTPFTVCKRMQRGVTRKDTSYTSGSCSPLRLSPRKLTSKGLNLKKSKHFGPYSFKKLPSTVVNLHSNEPNAQVHMERIRLMSNNKANSNSSKEKEQNHSPTNVQKSAIHSLIMDGSKEGPQFPIKDLQTNEGLTKEESNSGLEESMTTISGKFKHPLDLRESDYDFVSSFEEEISKNSTLNKGAYDIMTQPEGSLIFRNGKGKKKITNQHLGFQKK